MTLLKTSLMALAVVLSLGAWGVYYYTKGNLWLLGYPYARTSIFFAGIKIEDYWEIEDSGIYCGITKDGQYVTVALDRIFISADLKDVCLNP